MTLLQVRETGAIVRNLREIESFEVQVSRRRRETFAIMRPIVLQERIPNWKPRRMPGQSEIQSHTSVANTDQNFELKGTDARHRGIGPINTVALQCSSESVPGKCVRRTAANPVLFLIEIPSFTAVAMISALGKSIRLVHYVWSP